MVRYCLREAFVSYLMHCFGLLDFSGLMAFLAGEFGEYQPFQVSASGRTSGSYAAWPVTGVR